MFTESVQKRAGWLIGASVFLVTVVITPANTLDPINVPKLWLLATFAFGLLALLAGHFKIFIQKRNWVLLGACLATPFFMLISLIFSGNSIAHQLFGAYGRNTGLIAYFSLGIIALTSALFGSPKIKKPFLWGTAGALSVNAVYGFIQAIGKDPQKWQNPYSSVFGTLGNPNFVSAFLGFGSAFAIAYLLATDTSFRIKIICSGYIIISLFDIYKSKSEQGLIVFFLVCAVIFFFQIRKLVHTKYLHFSYLILVGTCIVLAVAGSLQVGPLSSMIYRSSVTQRGDYWHAGLNMLLHNPLLGVGLDSYGEWYRFFRSPEAAARFSGGVVSNTAHNVFIDIAATAGIPALLGYLLLIVVALKSAWEYIISNKSLDPFFLSVFAAWIGYLAQSVISINNIGLGIWGWALTGILISMSKWQEVEVSSSKREKNSKSNIDFSGMLMAGGLIAGGVIGFIPFNADANFRNSLESGNPDRIYLAAQKWPRDTSRILYGAQVFQSNKISDKAETLVRLAIKENPRSFEAWQFLYNASSITSMEKGHILKRLNQLDPNNKFIN